MQSLQDQPAAADNDDYDISVGDDVAAGDGDGDGNGDDDGNCS